ncbi:MAG: glycerate kinase [Bacteroidota bacterium]|nr:glycerate kinase [Bacteroidota bacterium]
MNILLAPNAMKGSLSATAIAGILANTLQKKFPSASIVSIPIADGGNGTLDCLMNALGGIVFHREVTGPIPSMKVQARFGITKDNIAIIESAEAIGLHLLSPSAESIAQSTSRGVGELIVEAVHRHCKEIWIGLGGTATNDGGAGMARALGIDYRDERNQSLDEGSLSLIHLKKIMNYELRIMKDVKTILLSDVTNPLLGSQGATYTFARQKGANGDQLPYLEAALKNFSDVLQHDVKKNFVHATGSGAAGGLGFGLLTFCNATLVSGIDFILDTIQFNEKLHVCDFVITTEGMLDEQTLFGKGIAGITQRASLYKKPVHTFAGRILGDKEKLKKELGLASLTEISPHSMSTEEAMKNAGRLLADALFHHQFRL